MFNYLNPTRDEREQIITAAMSVFKQRFYDPDLNGFDLDGTVEVQMPHLLATQEFPEAMRSFFRSCGAEPIDFFYEPEHRLPLARLIKTTLFEADAGECLFRDVLTGGRAEDAGIQSGDSLTAINNEPPRTQNYTVHAHQPFQVSVKRNGATTRNLTFPPPSTWRARREKNVMFRDLGGGIGYIRIASWPGILGLDVARETDIAIKRLRSKRLIIDLRGNVGSAGAGNLRIMSYLTPHKIPVGYSLTRRRAQNGYERQELPRFERIPRSKLEIPLVLWRFRKVDKSIVIVTEGLKPQGFHGHITLLVNRHTISGAEIVVHFAKQHGLAKIVGERTAGRTLSHSTLQLPCDFRFTLPIGDYVPWNDDRFEGCGVKPDVEVPFEPPKSGVSDLQLEEAIRVAR
jgi:carboxyl-terminal processing protease